MNRTNTIIIGAGQAGLAMSRCLSDRSVAHVVIERGDPANAWASERWNSLRLLTPNWQSRLPGFSYRGADPDGYMTMNDIVAYLQEYATLSRAPVETRTHVLSVDVQGRGYRVRTDRGDYVGRNVVLATGACSVARIPACSRELPRCVVQLTPLQYRHPGQLPEGRVLVVGASASGVQLAAEIREAGHEVTLSVGEHIRMPRHYRGRDIQWWMEHTGINDATLEQIEDVDRARRVPSLQLSGSLSTPLMDLTYLQSQGVEITGRLQAIRDGELLFSGSLANQCALSDLKMNRLLTECDAWADADLSNRAGEHDLLPPYRFDDTQVPAHPLLQCDLSAGRFQTVVWATGFQPDFGYVKLPVFDRKSRLRHEAGHVAPGLYVLGLPFMRRRKSALIDGVGDDAQALADHLLGDRDRRAA